MTMIIRFNQHYSKIPPTADSMTTSLIAVQLMHRNDLPQCFVKYDTDYIDEENEIHTGWSNVKDGPVILVLLLTGTRLWSTVRNYNARKFENYEEHIGEMVEVVIESDEIVAQRLKTAMANIARGMDMSIIDAGGDSHGRA